MKFVNVIIYSFWKVCKLGCGRSLPYVRTEEGEISKIKWITAQRWEGLENTIEASFMLENNESLEYPRDNFKASDSIIDLIEPGDYVNGKRVYNISIVDGLKYLDVEVEDYLSDMPFINADQITSIVTKEQFDSMKYEVE